MTGEKRRELLYTLAVAVLAFVVYANSLQNGFVGDDHSVVLNNPALRGSPISLFGVIDTSSDMQLLPFYRPLTYLAFMLEDRLHGLNPFMMHLFNVLLHAANAFLVYRLARSLINDGNAALLVGFLFAVHPLHTEGVNFISGGRNTLLACFFLLAAYLSHRRSVIHDNFAGAFAGAFLLLGGLFSKETALMIVPFIVAQEIFPLLKNTTGTRPRAVIRLLPYIAAVAGYLVMRWMTLSGLGIQEGLMPGFSSEKLREMYVVPGLGERLINNFYILPHYLLSVVWPLSFSPRYAIPGDFSLFVLPLVIGWISILGIGGWLLIKSRSSCTVFGLAWLILFWLPVSGIVFFSGVQMADRFLYIPAIGIWLVVADQAALRMPSRNAARRYVYAGAALILLLLAVLTIRRNMDWRSDMTLFTRVVEQYPENPHGHLNLGSAYLDRRGPNDLVLAEKEFEEALSLDRELQTVYAPLGYIQMEQGDFEKALYYYSEALSFEPMARDARINRGIAYEKLGRYDEALADYEFYLRLTTFNNVPGSQEYAEARVRELRQRLDIRSEK
ncbi:MAG: tetratricopeptide repeat protein [Nitrospirae bacterium]|nr:tetratricopeptide repeat protein [Nitrospirota bacterium]